MDDVFGRIVDGQVEASYEEEGLFLAGTWEGEILTPYGGGYNVDSGWVVRLYDSGWRVGYCEWLGDRDLCAAQVAPWAASMALLARVKSVRRGSSRVRDVLDRDRHVVVEDDKNPGHFRLAYNPERWAAEIRELAAPEDLERPEGYPSWKALEGRELAERILSRLDGQRAEFLRQAGAALPPAETVMLSPRWLTSPVGMPWQRELKMLIHGSKAVSTG